MESKDPECGDVIRDVENISTTAVKKQSKPAEVFIEAYGVAIIRGVLRLHSAPPHSAQDDSSRFSWISVVRLAPPNRDSPETNVAAHRFRRSRRQCSLRKKSPPHPEDAFHPDHGN